MHKPMREPKHEKDQIDLLIDSATATYAESPAGLQHRVLNALNAERLANTAPSNPRFPLHRRLPWAIALSAAACVLLVLLMHIDRAPRESHAKNHSLPQQLRSSPPAAVVTNGRAQTVKALAPKLRQLHPAAAAVASAYPKLDVFPTPQSLTPQEQALVSYTTRASTPQLQALIKAQHQPEKPLNIAAIHIPPVNLPEEGNN